MRVGVIGMGWVGSSVAVASLQRGVASELLVDDVRGEVAEGEAMDLAQGAPFYPSAKVRRGALEEMVDADAVVIAAGRGGGPAESRLELLRDNAAIVGDLARRLAALRGILIVVTNPVDVLTRIAVDASGLPPERVLGTGTMLDTARLRHVLAREIEVDPRSVHGYVLGEHGDSEVVTWSAARVGGQELRRWPGWAREREQAIATEVRRAAYEIIRRKGATNHAIGFVTAALLQAVLRDERRVLTVSRVQQGTLGVRGVALSLPAVVGRGGATRIVEPTLDDEERAAFERSAEVLERAHAALAEDA